MNENGLYENDENVADQQEVVDDSNTDTTEEAPKKGSFVNELCDMLESVLFSIFTVILIFTFVFKVASVIGSSMEPTLHGGTDDDPSEGDKLIVSSTFYNNPQQKDIVIINAQTAHLLSDTDDDGEVDDVVESTGLGKTIVKRIVAVGGQTVDIDFDTGNVYVDGEVLNEPYINDPTTRDEYAFEYPITVPEGYVFVMGDNRGVSKDSRSYEVGLISEDDIIGKVVWRISPLDKFGSVE